MQTRMQSIVEVVTNTLTGMLGSWCITFWVISHIDDNATASSVTVVLCTIWSLARGYFIRRRFNSARQERRT